MLYHAEENLLCVGDASGTITFFDLTQFWVSSREALEGRAGASPATLQASAASIRKQSTGNFTNSNETANAAANKNDLRSPFEKLIASPHPRDLLDDTFSSSPMDADDLDGETQRNR